ncbi:ankyrin repeat-containing domain protein [Phyllosticta citrichinensis]
MEDDRIRNDTRLAFGLDGVDGEMVPGELDFVTVHGLHGNRKDTWIAPDAPDRNMITEIAGDRARVMNYGYDVLESRSGVYFENGIAKEATNLLRQLTEARKGLSSRSFCTKDMEDKITRLAFSGARFPLENTLSRIKSLTNDVLESNRMFVDYLAKKHAFQDFVVSLSPPLKPCARLGSSYDGLHWLTKHEKFAKWQENPESDILIVEGATAISGRISELIYRTVSEKDDTRAYKTFFRFDMNDDRCNNLRSFLASVVAGWIASNHGDDWAMTTEFSRFTDQRSFTDWDLLTILIKMRTFDVVEETVFVLDRVDQCPQLAPMFWTHMAKIFETRDHPWKFILFTDSLEALGDEWLMKWPCISLKDRKEGSLDIEPAVASKLKSILLQLPETEDEIGFSIEKAAEEFTAGSAYCGDVVRFVLRQLQRFGSRATSGVERNEGPLSTLAEPNDSFLDVPVDYNFGYPAALSGVNLSSETYGAIRPLQTMVGKLIEKAMGSVPEEQRTLVVDTITWILSAFRPLSMKELASALSVDQGLELGYRTQAQNFVAWELEEILPGVFEFDHEVRFATPELREFFQKADGAWYDTKKRDHGSITQTCLKYLCRPTCRDSLDRLCTVRHGTLSTSTVKPRDDLAAYAAEYWPRHFDLAPQTANLLACVNEFFQNSPAVRAWEQARWFISNPLTRTEQCYTSIQPLVGSMGLRGIPAPYSDDEDRRYTLIEATRNGQLETAQNLVETLQIDVKTAEAVLLAASSHGDETFQIDLVQRFLSLDAFKLPRRLILRASWLGQYELVKLLIKYGADPDTDAEDPLQYGPLFLAARHGHCEVARLIINFIASLISKPADDDLPLSLASRHGDPKMVKLLLDCGADKNAAAPKALRPVSSACFDGKHAAARVLLEAGADPNLPDPSGRWPPLIIAAGENYTLCVQLLLEYGADIEAETSGGTPLYQAVWNGRTRICRILLEHGANVNYCGSEGSILAAAAGRSNLELVKLLIEKGADLNARATDEDYTALHRAIADSASIEVIKCLIDSGADPNIRTPGGAPLYHAVFQKKADVVRLLIDGGARVDVSAGVHGWTPLHAANKHAEITRMLLDAGADVDAVVEVEGSGNSALMLAATFDKPEVVDTLLEFGADVNLRGHSTPESDKHDITALFAAVIYGHVNVARKLLEAGADVNFQHKWNAILHCAASSGEAMLRTVMEFRPNLALQDDFGNIALNRPLGLSCAKILVHGGSDVNHANNAGRTPLSIAVSADLLDMARFLLKKGANVEAPGVPLLHKACAFGSLDGVKMLLEANADINRIHPESGSPLYATCERPRYSKPGEPIWVEEDSSAMRILEYLLKECERKPDPNQAGGQFGIPLSAGCAYCSTATVDVLLDAGADLDIYDDFGRYPIHFAARSSKENFQRLCIAGADLSYLDKSERSVLHYAVQSGDVNLVRCVIEATDGLLHVADAHGWTPLLFAARGSHHIGLSSEAGWSAEVIKLLLDEGADLCVVSRGHEGDWSPLKLARYHGAPEEIQKLFTPGEEIKAAKSWDEDEHRSRKAARHSAYCDCCLFVNTPHVLIFYTELTLVNRIFKAGEMGPEFEEESSKPSDHDTSDDETDDGGSDDSIEIPESEDAETGEKLEEEAEENDAELEEE